MNTTVNQRFKKIQEKYEKSINSFAAKINISQTALSNIINKEAKPSFEVLIATIEAFPEVDINWLVTGNGEMLKQNLSLVSEPQVPYGKHAEKLLDVYEKLSDCQEENIRLRNIISSNNMNQTQSGRSA